VNLAKIPRKTAVFRSSSFPQPPGCKFSEAIDLNRAQRRETKDRPFFPLPSAAQTVRALEADATT